MKTIVHFGGVNALCTTVRSPVLDDDLVNVTCSFCLAAVHKETLCDLRNAVLAVRAAIRTAAPQLRLTGSTELQQAALADLVRALNEWYAST